jgi:diguanylate cyclase (GGDEF)-like protein
MGTKKSILTTLASIMVVVFLAIIINITLNLREFGFNSAKTKAELVAQNVKNGLTAHMINGIMSNRTFYINQTRELEHIDDIWIVRSDIVQKQYGEGSEIVRDEIDKEVLKNGKTMTHIDENFFGHSTYRITIPYKAEITPNINCIQCHEAKVGDTLGVISMVMNMDDLKQTSTKIVAYTSLISFVLVVIILWFVNRLIYPYLTIFESIKSVMQKSHSGDYSGRVEGVNSGEAKEVAHWINEHMSKLQNSLIKIGDTIDVFLTEHKTNKQKDPIVDVENTVDRLADIYKFRRTIEHDEHIENVYERFAYIISNKFNIEDFNIIEADTTNKVTEVVYVNKKLICDPLTEGCRADRTNTLVDSCQFHDVCETMKEKKYYLCMPYSISNDMDLVVSFILDTKEEYDRVRGLLPLIQDYVEAAKPEIVSKKLMQTLERNASTDPLTGLYNRKYLEKFIDNSLYSGVFKDIPCGIMMVDIDFFKQINDNYGHDIGDIAIKTIANTLIDVVSNTDVVIRFGGEEFIVILTNCDEDKLQDMAEEIRIAFSQQKIQAGAETFSKTVSIGTSLFPNKQHDFWKYVKQSDIALYSAKQNGRDRVVRYQEGME